jgi:hypothetical protein
MVQCCDGPGLTLEAGADARLGRRIASQDLDGDVAPEFRIAGAIDFAHSSGPDGGKDLV